MPLVLGIDEAGYGPTLGPLVVSGTLWRVAPERMREGGWTLLRECVRRDNGRGDWRFVVGDSKAVFDRKKGLHTLERTVLAFARAAGMRCGRLAEFLAEVTTAPVPSTEYRIANSEEQIQKGVRVPPEFVLRHSPFAIHPCPWYHQLDLPLPADPKHSAAPGASERLEKAMQTAGCRCEALLAELVTEDFFNQRVRATRNKAAVLVEHVLRIIARAARRAECPPHPAEPAECPPHPDGRVESPPRPAGTAEDLLIRIDRLGGRTEYRALLAAAFPERSMRVVETSETRSRYVLEGPRNRWFLEFGVEADSRHLPVALASMLAKYLRELLMDRFNAFWRQWLPALRPTAGYYTDAQRFLADIGPILPQVGLAAEQFVRTR